MSVASIVRKLVFIILFVLVTNPALAERAHLKISSVTGGWEHLKMGNNPSNVWGPQIDVTSHTSLQLVVKDLGGADWSKLQVAPNGSNGVTIGNHFNGNASDWVTVTIPLSAFPSSAMASLSHLSLPFSNGASPYAFGLDSATFVGDGQDLIWFDAESKNDNAIQGSILHELIPDDGNGGGDQPDLTISDLQSVGTGQQGEVVSYRFDLNNIGDVVATDSYIIGAFLSTDSTFSNDDVQAGVVNTGNTPLGTIQNIDAAITVPNDLAAGSYTLILAADINNDINEKSETNNTVGIPFTVTGGNGGELPDLRAIGILDLPPGLDPGDSFTTRFRFENAGTAAVDGDYVVSIVLSDDSFISTDDRVLRSFLFGNTSVGGQVTSTRNIILPNDVAPGDYRMILNVDGGNNIVESNENNNIASRGVRVFGTTGDLPDLTVSDLQSVAVGEPGEIVIYTFDLNNIGDIIAADDYTIAAFLSTDTNFSSDDVEVGTVSTGNTPVGTIDDVGAAITVDEDLEPGDYHLILVADRDSEILEKSETNNTTSIPFAVTTGGGGGGGGDDVQHLHVNNTIGGWQKLKIGHNPNNLWGPPISPVNGNTHLELVVKDFAGNMEWDKIAVIINDRNGSDTRLGNFLPSNTSGWFTIRIPLSIFPANIFDDISRIELFSRDATPWEIGIASITFTGGSSEFVWLGEENNQHNNAVDSNFITTIEVDEGSGGGGDDKPDLTVTNMSQPASGEAGDVVNFTFNLNNIGDVLAENSYFIGAFVSQDNTIDDGDALAGVVPTGNTPVGTITAVPAAITVPDLAPGTYRLILQADVDNTVDELNEGNNVTSRSFTITSSTGPTEINIDRTMTETAVEVLNVFTLENLLNQLASQSGDADLSGLGFWRQFWDTQNTGPGLGRGAHCDDESVLNPTFNGYPLECPRTEGDEVNNDPFDVGAATAYEPIALSNRFDLAGTDGSSCGQYRITFARNSGKSSALRRNFVIFEAELPNPAPSCGIEGCRPITDFWVSLSEEEDPAVRAQRLQDFYFNGIPSENVSPVFHVNNYMAGTGQIRTNQFLNTPFSGIWQLREYKIGVFCAGNDCDMQAVPVTVKENPQGELFDTSFSDPRAEQFRSFFPSQIESLAEDDLNLISMLIPDDFLPGQSNSQGVQSNYSFHLDQNGSFATTIQNRLNQLGSGLTPGQIANRATTQACGGCHQISNGRDLGDGLSWPFSLGFVHTSESTFVDSAGVERHQRSQALNDVFLPHRAGILQDFNDNVGSCAAQGRSLATESLRSGPAAKTSSADSGLAVNAIQVAGDNKGNPVALSPEELRTLDEQRKAGRSDESMGGPARSH